MPDKMIVNVPPYIGEYELDFEGQPLTTLEWRWVRKISDYLPGTLMEGMTGADPALICAFAVIAMRRSGRISKEQVLGVAEVLADAPFDGAALQFVPEPVEDEADPPVEAPPASEGGNGEKTSSGDDSRSTSESQEQNPSPTGPPASAMRVISDRETLAS